MNSRARLPAVNARRVIAALQRAGFVIDRTSGSHCVVVLPRDRSRWAVVPKHGPADLRPGTLKSILRQAGLSVEEFIALL